MDYAMKWYMNEQKKRETQRKEYDIQLMNQQLSRIIENLKRQVDTRDYQEKESEINRRLVSCSIWRVCYQSNLTNPDVLKYQAMWIATVFTKENGTGKIKHEDGQKREFSTLLRRIQHIEFSTYSSMMHEYPEIHAYLN